MKKIIFICLFLTNSVLAKFFSSKLVDSKTGAPIIDANIQVVESKTNGTISDDNGIFYIELPNSNQSSIKISAIGYKQKILPINSINDNLLIVEIEQDTIQYNAIEVLAERTKLIGNGRNYFRTPGSFSFVSKREVLQFKDTDINHVIAQVPGVYSQQEEGYGLRPNIGMRGSGLERSAKINMMEDGIPISPAPYSSPAAYYSPTTGRMESFEIRKGSSQIKYGPHSTGGAINYISSNIPHKLSLNGSLSYGDFNSTKFNIKSGISGKNFGILFQSFLDKNNGFKNIDDGSHSGFDKKDFLLKTRINSNSNNIALEAKFSKTEELSNETYLGLTRSDFKLTPYRRYLASQNDQMEADHNQFTISSVVKFLENYDFTVTFYDNSFHRNWYKLNKVNNQSIGSILSSDNLNEENYQLLFAEETEDDIFEVKANNRLYYSRGIQSIFRSNLKLFGSSHNILVGTRFHKDEMDRYQWADLYKMNDRKLFMTTQGLKGAGSKNNRLYSASANSIFIEDELSLNKLLVSFGARYEKIHLKRQDWGNDLERDSTASIIKNADINIFIPGFGISYQINNSVQIFSGIHSGFSPPGPGIDGEDNILPEESINIELGARLNNRFQKLELVSFYNNYKNLLGEDNESTGSGTYEQFNGGKVLVKGLELSYNNLFRTNNGFNFPLTISYTYTDAKFKNSFDSDFEPWGEVKNNDEIPYIPKNMLYTSFGVLSSKFESYLRFKFIDNTRIVAGKDNFSSLNSNDQQRLFDFVTKYNLESNISLSLKVYNVFNSIYSVASRPAGLRPNMPRYIESELNFNF